MRKLASMEMSLIGCNAASDCSPIIFRTWFVVGLVSLLVGCNAHVDAQKNRSASSKTPDVNPQEVAADGDVTPPALSDETLALLSTAKGRSDAESRDWFPDDNGALVRFDALTGRWSKQEHTPSAGLTLRDTSYYSTWELPDLEGDSLGLTTVIRTTDLAAMLRPVANNPYVGTPVRYSPPKVGTTTYIEGRMGVNMGYGLPTNADGSIDYQGTNPGASNTAPSNTAPSNTAPSNTGPSNTGPSNTGSTPNPCLGKTYSLMPKVGGGYNYVDTGACGSAPGANPPPSNTPQLPGNVGPGPTSNPLAEFREWAIRHCGGHLPWYYWLGPNGEKTVQCTKPQACEKGNDIQFIQAHVNPQDLWNQPEALLMGHKPSFGLDGNKLTLWNRGSNPEILITAPNLASFGYGRQCIKAIRITYLTRVKTAYDQGEGAPLIYAMRDLVLSPEPSAGVRAGASGTWIVNLAQVFPTRATASYPNWISPIRPSYTGTKFLGVAVQGIAGAGNLSGMSWPSVSFLSPGRFFEQTLSLGYME